MKSRTVATFFGLFALSVVGVNANANSEHCRPPEEAIDACQSLKVGDACSFEGPEGNLTGSCFTPDASKPLACRPADDAMRQNNRRGGERGGPMRRPPEEAIDACAGAISGEQCSFEAPEGELTGTCFSPDANKPLVCRPANAPDRQGEKRGNK